MTSAENWQPAGRRYWYQTIAGKLLTAFTLIAALTVIATLVAVIQFGNIDAVMRQLMSSSLPAVKYSLAVETNAKAIAAGGAQLATATTEVDRFGRISESTEHIGNLWSALSQLRGISGDTPEITRLQALIASIDERLGQLDRIIREKIAVFATRERIANRITPEVEAVVSRLAADAVVTNAMRADIHAAAATLHQASAATKLETIRILQQQFNAMRDRLAGAKTILSKEAGEALDVFVALGAEKGGLFQFRADELNLQRSADSVQSLLQQAATEMEQQVASLVSAAEQAAASTTALSASALANSEFWLIAISVLSLAAAVLIVWLFVIRYIVARLRELTQGMMAVAAGAIDTRIPEPGVDELGDMSRALLVFRDNAHEIRTAKEEAEQARFEAEAASRTKSAFLANMSHELRTPLNAIIGYSEILHEDASDRGDEASQADLVKIQSAGKHLLGLINDILDLSKIEAGRMDIHLEDVDLKKLVSDVRVLVAPLMDRNANVLEVDVPADIGTMRVDMIKLKQSLINLLSNAAKFTNAGTVGLKISRNIDTDGHRVFTFSVADSGIGMNEDQIGRLFQAFTQADPTTTRNFGGTGLGLTITKHFSAMLGGNIEVSSKPGVGSIFTLTLPDAGKRDHSILPVEATPRVSGVAAGKTILVVDDDPAVHDVLRVTLSKEGYRLLHAYDGAEALDMVAKDPPDVITLDVMMPRVDGWTVLGKLKSDADLARIPVIMLTVVDERTMGYSLGAAEYMTKPIDRARLIELLRRFATQSREAVVLVVDDDADVRAIVKSTVEKTGLKAAEANDGRVALDWLASNPAPALILLDLMMPVMDGFEFLERVKDIHAASRVPIVVLTAKDLTDSERRIINERTLLVLTKGAQPLSSLGSALSVIARQGAKLPERV